MRAMAVVPVVIILSLAAAHAGGEALVKKELEALRGRWNVVKEENDLKVQFSMVEDSLQMNLGGATIDFRYVVDPAKKPKHIDIIRQLADGSDKAMLGIYHLEGDTLKLCFGDKRPTEFKADAATKQGMYVLKREKK